MAITTITNEGAFDATIRKQVNDNFSSLSASTAGGTLTSAHILVGNSSNVAADVAVSGDATLANTGALTVVSMGGVKFAGGITALDGSNPTSITTGLTTVTGFAATVNATTGNAVITVTYGTISAGTVPVYGWLQDGTASTGTNNIAWIASGT